MTGSGDASIRAARHGAAPSAAHTYFGWCCVGTPNSVEDDEDILTVTNVWRWDEEEEEDISSPSPMPIATPLPSVRNLFILVYTVYM